MPVPVQQKIDIKDIKDGVVILESGALRAVLICSSVNFFLKSTEEQDALTYGYQGFLNSLDFPLQILICSRKFDVSDYLALLEEKQRTQENELLKIQTTEYIDFVKSLTEMANIMAESFFVVIPFAPIEKKSMTFLEKISQPFKKQVSVSQDFEQMKAQLWQRVEYVMAGLNHIGIKTAPLNTEELIELYYDMYNPEAKEKPTIKSTREQTALK